jgi:diaminobutyrate-2-oxoglutarate transaminase
MSYDYLKLLESNARTYARFFNKVFSTGHGMRVRDSQGNEYIDCLAVAGALPLGHNHPEIKQAVVEYISSDGIQQALDFSTPAKIQFVKDLFSRLPPKLRDDGRIQFCGPTGSDAVEAALKLAKFYTKRQGIMAFHGSYHGMTSGALGLMGNLHPKTGVGLAAAGVQFAPFPYRFRCPFGTNGAQTDQLSINYIRTILSDPESGVSKPAAIIVEAVQGEGGAIPASIYWLQELRKLTLEFDVPLIIDEVQTGLGRTGTLFAIERAGITPDILVLSKAIGGGYPLSVVVYDKRFDVWTPGMHAGTFRGNQLAMVAGSTTMRVIDRDGLVDNANKIGDILKKGLIEIAQHNPVLGDVRGLGLMIGVEIVKPGADDQPGAPDGELAKLIKRNCFKNRLIIETGGRNGCVLRFLPPLIATEADAGEILDRFEQAVEAVEIGAVHA